MIAASSGAVDAAYRVSERWQAETVGGVLLDATSARAIIAVAEALSLENRERLNALPVERAAAICWRLVA